MTAAFQNNAFQNNAFQTEIIPPVPIVIDDTHDGIFRKKLDEEYRRKNFQRKKSIIDAYERLVEGKVDIVNDIVAEFSVKPKKNAKLAAPQINFDKLIQRVDKVEALWDAYLEMDDEDILVMM
ncbi:hypothetical protein UFOVP1545_3 [uncultured Caudovirales phage]|uniref:Uncharacterized protein n=1 Tax=uncultured Caudovirales phage TaxID=2100421 RepID=A0A6J7XES0_9CAUD|nr:hypothetical protein UFOVP1545_3 [uncultured Caudovirales phage]